MLLRILVLVLSAALMIGCSASSRYMKEGGVVRVDATSDRANIIFFRSSGLGFAVKFLILDGQGKFVGEPLAEGYHSIEVPAGEVTFYAEAENTAAVKGTVEAGRTYYLLVDPRFGLLSAQVELLVIKPGGRAWDKTQGWIKELTPYEVQLMAGDGSVNGDKRSEIISDGEDAWADYDAEERALRTIEPGDGRVTAVAPPKAAPISAPTPAAVPAAVPADPRQPAPIDPSAPTPEGVGQS